MCNGNSIAAHRQCRIVVSNKTADKKLKMTRPEIEAKSKRLYSLLGALMMTGVLAFFINQEGKNLFDWAKFNPNIINSLLFLLFLVICLYWWLKYFDERPILKLNSDGISVRSNILFLSRQKFISWTQVNYFYILEETQKSTTVSLMIGQKEIKNEKKIELSGLDKSVDDILFVIKEYSAFYNLQDLGIDRRL